MAHASGTSSRGVGDILWSLAFVALVGGFLYWLFTAGTGRTITVKHEFAPLKAEQTADPAPAWQPGIPPGNGRVTRVSEFDRDGQAYCDKYAPGSSFVMWIGAGMGRKARCG